MLPRKKNMRKEFLGRERGGSLCYRRSKAADLRTECSACKGSGDDDSLLRCDECGLFRSSFEKNLLNEQAMDGYVRNVILHLLRKVKMKLKRKMHLRSSAWSRKIQRNKEGLSSVF